MSTSAAYARLMERLEQSPESVIELGVDVVRDVIHHEGLSRPAPIIITIAGTNGKGTVAAFLSQLCTASGWTTTLMTSPHLVSFRERIRIQGVPIEEDLMVSLGDPILQKYGVESQRIPRPLTYFELSIVLGLRAAQATHSDVLIMEVGLGGRLDATNAIDTDVAVFTSLSLDHTQLLGNTIGEIAYEKAQIARRGCPAVVHKDFTGVRELEHELQIIGANILYAAGGETSRDKNIALATYVFSHLMHARGRTVPEAMVETVRDSFQWPGRLTHTRSPSGTPFFIDGAHNAASAQELARTLARHPPDHSLPALVAVSGGRAVADIVGPVSPWVSSWHLCAPDFAKMMSTAQVEEQVRAWEANRPSGEMRRPIFVHKSVYDGLQAVEQDVRNTHAPYGLIFGSLYLVGDVYRQWIHADPHALDLTRGRTGINEKKIGS